VFDRNKAASSKIGRNKKKGTSAFKRTCGKVYGRRACKRVTALCEHRADRAELHVPIDSSNEKENKAARRVARCQVARLPSTCLICLARNLELEGSGFESSAAERCGIYRHLNGRNTLFARLFRESPDPTSSAVTGAFEVAMNRPGRSITHRAIGLANEVLFAYGFPWLFRTSHE
jgi:hypothetical protein